MSAERTRSTKEQRHGPENTDGTAYDALSRAGQALFCLRYLHFESLGLHKAYVHLLSSSDYDMLPWLTTLQMARRRAFDDPDPPPKPTVGDMRQVYEPLLSKYLPGSVLCM